MSAPQLELNAMYTLKISGKDLSRIIQYLNKPSDQRAIELRERLIELRISQTESHARASRQIKDGAS